LHWFHVASNRSHTYYECHAKRGQIAMDQIGILSAFTGRAVHDGLKSYFSYDFLHQLCNAHHLRELTFLVEQHQQVWAQNMKALILDIKEQVDTARENGSTSLAPAATALFECRYSELISAGYAENPEAQRSGKRGRTAQSKGRNLVNRLDQNRTAVLAFMYDFDVPFGNYSAQNGTICDIF
jgi:transposase